MRTALLAFVFVMAAAALSHAAEWREGYIVFEGTNSPDGRYGIIVPTSEESGADESENYLVDLKSHHELGLLKGVHYFEHRNHNGLSADWSGDSSWCVITYDWRFGVEALSVIEIARARLIQTDLTKQVKIGTPHASCISVYLRISEDRKVRVRAVSTDDPKSINEKAAKFGLFQGTYDVRSKRWTVKDGRPLKLSEYDALSSAYGESADSAPAPAEDEPEEQLDMRLNNAYNGLRVILPAEKFAKIKAEQAAWLKARDAVKDEKARRELVRERVESLQDLLW
jgi:hypothetical protein